VQGTKAEDSLGAIKTPEGTSHRHPVFDEMAAGPREDSRDEGRPLILRKMSRALFCQTIFDRNFRIDQYWVKYSIKQYLFQLKISILNHFYNHIPTAVSTTFSPTPEFQTFNDQRNFMEILKGLIVEITRSASFWQVVQRSQHLPFCYRYYNRMELLAQLFMTAYMETPVLQHFDTTTWLTARNALANSPWA